jgi:hypothetical protein
MGLLGHKPIICGQVSRLSFPVFREERLNHVLNSRSYWSAQADFIVNLAPKSLSLVRICISSKKFPGDQRRSLFVKIKMIIKYYLCNAKGVPYVLQQGLYNHPFTQCWPWQPDKQDIKNKESGPWEEDALRGWMPQRSREGTTGW